MLTHLIMVGARGGLTHGEGGEPQFAPYGWLANLDDTLAASTHDAARKKEAQGHDAMIALTLERSKRECVINLHATKSQLL